MPHDVALIATLAIGFALAFVFGFAANRLGLPPLVGYLVAGVLVGPFTPGFVGDRASTGQLAEIGVMLLMFGVGLNFSVDDLIAVRGIAIPGAVGQILWVRARPKLNARFEESRGGRFARLKEELESTRRRQAEKAAANKTFTPEELVDRFAHFSGLTPEQREVLVLHFGSRAAEPGERIIRAGEKADAVYFVCQGEVEVSVADRRIKLGPGDFFGEMALISGLPRSADVTALDYCKLATLSRRDFRQFLSRYPDIREQIAAITAQRREMNRQLLSKGA